MTAARYNIGVLASNVLRFRRAMFCCCGNSFVLFSVCLYFIEFYVRKKFIASKFYGGWIIFFFFWKPKLVCNWERRKLICNSTMGALNLYKWTRVLGISGKIFAEAHTAKVFGVSSLYSSTFIKSIEVFPRKSFWAIRDKFSRPQRQSLARSAADFRRI